MRSRGITRRRFVTVSAAASASALAAPFVRTAHAAGKLSVGFWDHWVPGSNDVVGSLVDEWAAKEKVDVQVDFITSQGNKLLLTISAEEQAKAGHDILSIATWQPAQRALNLEPVDASWATS
jgi:ABC-type glycerol-3-phosphate transport system substrate-binding protein